MNRAPAIQNFLDNLAKSAFGRTAPEAIEKRICTVCGQAVTGFKNEVSVREYQITGYCQKCQDDVFEGGELNE
jgi:hypothetical protein